MVTRIKTIKNVNITVPNSIILNNHIVNYSTSALEEGVILHTSVTIGYDVPWDKVHSLLIDSARKTSLILDQPSPFVLQTALEDFYVAYELNAYTHTPSAMSKIYSDLHQNIQDNFKNEKVEILSPHYKAIRSGSEMAFSIGGGDKKAQVGPIKVSTDC